MNILAQIFGTIALLLLVISYLQVVRKKFLFLQIIANVFYSLQYLVLNAYSAVMTTFITIIELFIFHKDAEENDAGVHHYLCIIGVFTGGLCILAKTFGAHEAITAKEDGAKETDNLVVEHQHDNQGKQDDAGRHDGSFHKDRFVAQPGTADNREVADIVQPVNNHQAGDDKGLSDVGRIQLEDAVGREKDVPENLAYDKKQNQIEQTIQGLSDFVI